MNYTRLGVFDAQGLWAVHDSGRGGGYLEGLQHAHVCVQPGYLYEP